MSWSDTIKATLTEDNIRALAFILTILVVGFLVVTGRAIPQELSSLLMLIAGFYFGRGVTNHSDSSSTKKLATGGKK